jgi:hypothetical protein
VCLGGVAARTAQGDGGTVRLSSVAGRYRVSAFTSPAPLRAGLIDISVMVQDSLSGEPIHDAAVSLDVTSTAEPPLEIHVQATREAATNKLLRSAIFELPRAGPWRVDITIDGPLGAARSSFDFVADEPMPRWHDLWLWIAFPALPIALYTLAEIRRRRRERPATSIGSRPSRATAGKLTAARSRTHPAPFEPKPWT